MNEECGRRPQEPDSLGGVGHHVLDARLGNCRLADPTLMTDSELEAHAQGWINDK